MIKNWDIISRIDPKDQSRRFTLLTDGTEHDARLIAKKLAGYVQAPEPAVAPFVYAFELPADLDEDTLDKIRTAVKEGIEQTNKINQFVPGGILGDPLFNADVTKEDKEFPTFVTLDPSESFFKADKKASLTPEKQESSTAEQASEKVETERVTDFQSRQINIQESDAEVLGLNKQTVSASSEDTQTGEITISDKDMLIKDMEGTMLGQMPLEDIFSAETKYDMFLDLENQKLVKNSQQQREQKMDTLADGKDSLEESFNIFEQKIKDQTCIIDLDDLNSITDRLPKKDMDFLKHTAKAESSDKSDLKQNKRTPDTAAAVGKNIENAPDIPNLTPKQPEVSNEANLTEEKRAKSNVTAEDPFEQIEKTIHQNEQTAFSEEDSSGNMEENAAADLLTASSAEMDERSDTTEGNAFDEEPLNLGPAPERNTEITFSLEGHSSEQSIPEEVSLVNTVPPTSADSKTTEEMPEDLPEFTLRENKMGSLEKTFNLETTLNTEVMKQQYEKSFHDVKTDSPRSHQPLSKTPKAPPVLTEQGESKSKKVYLVKKKDNSQPILNKKEDLGFINSGDSAMEENQELKTTFRIRRKPEAPQAPVAPSAPVPPPAPKIQTPPPESSSASSKAAQRPAPAAANTIIEKTKTIDHSIEIPLSELKKHNWPLEVPLVPTYTLETMVMSVNRFAHATAISVIENPGKLYNPLVLHGATGTGKTHFLNAMAYAFSKKYGQENIFMTNGVRLSRGIQRYVMEGNIEKFEKFMDTVKVLLIDDIHLLAINEQNRVHISNLLNSFLRDQKQIVITSKYPPESLEKLEELIKFKLDSGWISELKPASGTTHLKIVKKMLLDNGVDLNDTQISEFFGGPHMTLGTVTRSIRRLKVLENLIFPHLPEQDRSHARIFEKLLATGGEDTSSEVLTHDPESITSISTTGNGEWGRIGFFYPQNSSHMMNWMVYALQQRANELGIEGGFEIAVRSSYATENIISSAFKIANLCDNKKLKGAVILGPALTVCDPSVRENFYDILTHMLEIMLIRCGIINFEDAKSPSTYVKVLSELLR